MWVLFSVLTREREKKGGFVPFLSYREGRCAARRPPVAARERPQRLALVPSRGELRPRRQVCRSAAEAAAYSPPPYVDIHGASAAEYKSAPPRLTAATSSCAYATQLCVQVSTRGLARLHARPRYIRTRRSGQRDGEGKRRDGGGDRACAWAASLNASVPAGRVVG